MGIEGLPPFDAAQEQDAPPKKRNNQATEATCRATSDSWWPPASPCWYCWRLLILPPPPGWRQRRLLSPPPSRPRRPSLAWAGLGLCRWTNTNGLKNPTDLERGWQSPQTHGAWCLPNLRTEEPPIQFSAPSAVFSVDSPESIWVCVSSTSPLKVHIAMCLSDAYHEDLILISSTFLLSLGPVHVSS